MWPESFGKNDWKALAIILGITLFPLWFPAMLIFIQWCKS